MCVWDTRSCQGEAGSQGVVAMFFSSVVFDSPSEMKLQCVSFNGVAIAARA